MKAHLPASAKLLRIAHRVFRIELVFTYPIEIFNVLRMESLSGLKIEKLNENSFHVWKQKVEFLLAFCELDDAVLNSISANDKDEKREWNKGDAKAKAIIGTTLTDGHLDHVCGHATAADRWNALVNLFQIRTLLNKLNAHRSFYSAERNDIERVLV